jgi:hypothetical protein
MFFSSGQNCCSHALAQDEERDNKIMVEVVTLDEAIKRNPFIIKIDVKVSKHLQRKEYHAY